MARAHQKREIRLYYGSLHLQSLKDSGESTREGTVALAERRSDLHRILGNADDTPVSPLIIKRPGVRKAR